MKVKELIEALKALPGEAEVLLTVVVCDEDGAFERTSFAVERVDDTGHGFTARDAGYPNDFKNAQELQAWAERWSCSTDSWREAVRLQVTASR